MSGYAPGELEDKFWGGKQTPFDYMTEFLMLHACKGEA